MTIDPIKTLSRPRPLRYYILVILMTAYVAFSLFLFFQWVGPSLVGDVPYRIAADSTEYMYFARVIRERIPDPFVLSALATFPNNLWVPVLIAFVFNGAFVIVVANYAMLFFSIYCLRKAFTFSTRVFLGLMLLNATTTISILTVNKEIVDLLAISVFLFARYRGYKTLLVLAFLVAFFNRSEVGFILLLYMLLNSGLNPLRRKRALTLLILVASMTILLPLVASKTLAEHFVEASDSHLAGYLDNLEMHYMFALTVIPKLAENFFAELFNVSKWRTSYGNGDLANSWIVLSNNLATLIVCLVLLKQRAYKLRSDLMYFATLGCIIMSVSLVVQPRYFYFVYVVLCLEASLLPSPQPPSEPFALRNPSPEITHA